VKLIFTHETACWSNVSFSLQLATQCHGAGSSLGSGVELACFALTVRQLHSCVDCNRPGGTTHSRTKAATMVIRNWLRDDRQVTGC